jgi:hypothetical protein
VDRTGRGGQSRADDCRRLGVELVLSLNRAGDGGSGLDVGVPVSPVTIKFSAEQSAEARRESSLTLPFMLYQQKPEGGQPGVETINCSDPKSRLPEPVLPLRAITEQLNRSGTGKPYFGWYGNGGAPSACIVIEDSASGVQAGVAAGMTVIGLSAGNHCRAGHAERLSEAGAYRVVDSWLEVAKLLSRA